MYKLKTYNIIRTKYKMVIFARRHSRCLFHAVITHHATIILNLHQTSHYRLSFHLSHASLAHPSQSATSFRFDLSLSQHRHRDPLRLSRRSRRTRSSCTRSPRFRPRSCARLRTAAHVLFGLFMWRQIVPPTPLLLGLIHACERDDR